MRDSRAILPFAGQLLAAGCVAVGCAAGPTAPTGCDQTAATLPFGSCLVFEDGGGLGAHHTAINAAVQETLTAVNARMSIDGLTIRVQGNTPNVIPEIGVGGFNPSATEVIIAIDPTGPHLSQVLTTHLRSILAHEIHHARRRRSVGYGSTLLQAAITEGLADHFSVQLAGIAPPPWSVALSGAELAHWIDEAAAVWSEPYNHPNWFLGATPAIPRWTGYAIGYELVRRYLVANPGQTAASLVDLPASRFITP